MATLEAQFGENTIDEPVSETILRDLRLVRLKLNCIVQFHTAFFNMSHLTKLITMTILLLLFSA